MDNHSNRCSFTNLNSEIIFESVEQFWEMSSDMAGPIMEALKNAPTKVVEDIKAAVLDKAKKIIKSDGKMHSNWEALLIRGVKK